MNMTAKERDQYDWVVGPRQVGGRYYSGYWGDEYTVLAIEPGGPCGWLVTEATDKEAAQGRSRTHHTPWDPQRDSVVRQP